MKIYIAHSRGFDYINELYLPLKKSELYKRYEFILPHENDNYLHDRDYYKNVDLVIGEVSYPSTGLGIELGFLYDDEKPIYCIFKKGKKISTSICDVTSNVCEYNDTNDILETIRLIIENDDWKE